MVKQVSIFLENKEGRLAKALNILGENKVNIRALSIAETADFGILRLIVDKTEEAIVALRNGGFRVVETDVLAVKIPDKPGGLASILSYLADEGINIEYMYAFLAKESDDAIVIFRVEKKEKTMGLLNRIGTEVLSEEILSSL